MKSKEQIYNDVKELVEAQDKENYLVYYKIFLDNSGRHDIPTEEKEAIINQAYSIIWHLRPCIPRFYRITRKVPL